MRPHRQQPTRLPRPWDSPGKNTGVGCHFLLQCMKVKSESEVSQPCPTLSNPMDCSPPGSSVHGIFQARVLEWDAIAFSDKRMLYLTTWIYLINNIEQNKTKEYILYEYICRHTSFYCASLYLHFLDTGFFKFFFLQIEGLWQSHIELVYWHHFFQHICSLNVCVSHFSNFQQYFKFFVITVFFMVICDQ